MKTNILHLITTAKNASPFDVNMAFDAGYGKIMPYTDVHLDEVVGLTQDAMFSRSPSGAKRQALFFGGRDVHVALNMQKIAKDAMFSPFEMSTFADPSGAFTTAAAVMAKVHAYLEVQQQKLSDQKIAIFGATGTVGTTTALIAAKQGATIYMVAHKGVESMRHYADELQVLYGVDLVVVDGQNSLAKKEVLNQVNVAICATPAGVRVLEKEDFGDSATLKVLVDVNAVPPLAVGGVDVITNGEKVEGTDVAAFGAMSVGQLKYVTQHKLIENMLEGEVPTHINYHHAFEFACANAS